MNITKLVASLGLITLSYCAVAASWEQTAPNDVKAFRTGDLKTVMRLIEKKGLYTEFDQNVFMTAIESGNVQLISYLKSRGWLKACREESCFPLHKATSSGKLELVKFFMSEGFDPNATIYMRQNALHSAASAGELEVVTYLCVHGADNRAKDEAGRTPFDIARENRHARSGIPAEDARLRVNMPKVLEYLNGRDCVRK
jgi:hypothetical protein